MGTFHNFNLSLTNFFLCGTLFHEDLLPCQSVTWFINCLLQNGKKITSDIRYKTLEEDNMYTLLIIETFPEDTGKYECVAINSAGEARCDAQLLVQQPSPATPSKTQPSKPATPGTEQAPSIVEPLKAQVIREGQAVAFRCKISGRPGEQSFFVLWIIVFCSASWYVFQQGAYDGLKSLHPSTDLSSPKLLTDDILTESDMIKSQSSLLIRAYKTILNSGITKTTIGMWFQKL